MNKKLKIGTRGSTLAVTQTAMVKTALLEKFPELEIEIITILTSGDINAEAKLAEIGGKELFTREIDAAMISGEIDIAVHSLKDIPGIINPEIEIAAVLPRADARDILLGADSIESIPKNARFGSSSPRRTAQMLDLRPDLEPVYFRGNVPTRIEKLNNKVVDITLLAKAGLDRLGIEPGGVPLEPEIMLPAAGQGIIAITARPDDSETKEILSTINHTESFIAATCERAVLQAYEGDCYTPIAAHASINGGSIKLAAMIASEDGKKIYRTSYQGTTSQASELGQCAGQELLAQGL